MKTKQGGEFIYRMVQIDYLKKEEKVEKEKEREREGERERERERWGRRKLNEHKKSDKEDILLFRQYNSH